MVEANVSSTDTKEQSLKLRQPSLSIPVWMGDKWSGSFLSAYRNQRPMEAQKILPKEIHLKADGKNLLHMWVWVLFIYFFFLLLFCKTVTHAIHGKDIYEYPGESSPFRYVHFTITTLKIECKST